MTKLDQIRALREGRFSRVRHSKKKALPKLISAKRKAPARKPIATHAKRNGGRPRLYASDAEKQKAYRERLKANAA